MRKLTAGGDGKLPVRPLFILIMLLALFLRLWRFGAVPAGINQDEAFAGYEAWSLLHYGFDSSGCSFPVYFTSWGSGMNALGIYLMLPFVALFGPEVWAIRLAQLLVSCLSLAAVFGLVRRLAGDRAALFALLLLAFCPWHVYMSRWGLESNLAPGFLSFGLYFLVRGFEDERFLPLAALMYGLSLYAYAVLWPIMPLLLLLLLAYGFFCRRLRFSGWLCASAAILLALALPLMLFLLVNYGFIGELSIGPFTIPKLVQLRSAELSLSNIADNAGNLWRLLKSVAGGLPFKYTGSGGLFSVCTLPFFLLGLWRCIAGLARSLKSREPCLEAMLLFWLLSALLLGLLTAVNETRFNCAYVPMLITAALGLDRFVSLTKRELVTGLVFAAYLAHMGAFAVYYFRDYPGNMAYAYAYGLDEALELAAGTDGRIYLDTGIYYSDVLFYLQQPTDEYVETVVYKNYPSAFLDVASFGRCVFGIDPEDIDPGGAYVFLTGNEAAGALLDAGFALQNCGIYTAALPLQ